MAVAHHEMARHLANKVRIRRGEERRRIAALPSEEGREQVARLLESPPEWLASARIGTVLMWPRQIARHSMRKILREAKFRGTASDLRRVEELTDREVTALSAVLRSKASVAR